MKRGKDYEGLIQIQMEVLKAENVFIDFNGKKILEIFVNGVQTDNQYVEQNWKAGHLDLSSCVKVGTN